VLGATPSVQDEDPVTCILLFCSAGYGHCLQDEPETNLLARAMRRPTARSPGEAFDQDKQCELVFGEGAKICTYMVSTFLHSIFPYFDVHEWSREC
jgi:hypothetical protein